MLRSYSRSTFWPKAFDVAEVVDHDRVVDDQIDRHQRVDLGGVGAQGAHGVAHGGQVDHGGNAGEVLHQDAGRTEGDLVLDRALVLDPGGDGLQVIFCDGDPVLVAQQVLQQHLHGARQAGNPGQTGFLGGGKAVIGVFLTPDGKVLAGLEAVDRRHGEFLWSAPPDNPVAPSRDRRSGSQGPCARGESLLRRPCL